MLPAGVSIEPFDKHGHLYNRLTLLLNNAVGGLFLIFILLSIFLGWQISIWGIDSNCYSWCDFVLGLWGEV